MVKSFRPNVFTKLFVVLSIFMSVLAFSSLFSNSTFNTLGYFCHQLPNRSFNILGNQMGICCRCMGLYLGVCFHGLYMLRCKQNFYIILSGVSAAAATIYCKKNGIETNNISRFLSGALVGALVVFLFDLFTSAITISYLKVLHYIDIKLS